MIKINVTFLNILKRKHNEKSMWEFVYIICVNIYPLLLLIETSNEPMTFKN